MGYGQFNIELQRGEAKKAYSELSHEEQVQLGKDLFEQIKTDLAKRGQKPVTTESIKKRKAALFR